jgi:uncharacterized protein YjiS (DUF1127 family)
MSHASTWHSPHPIAPRLSSALQRRWSAYWARRQERATVLILNSLDDRILKDLGIDRSEIESIAHNPSLDRRMRSE